MAEVGLNGIVYLWLLLVAQFGYCPVLPAFLLQIAAGLQMLAKVS